MRRSVFAALARLSSYEWYAIVYLVLAVSMFGFFGFAAVMAIR